MIVCICNNVSDHKIRQAAEEGVVTMPQLRDQLCVGTCCGKCHLHAKQVLRESLINLAERHESAQASPSCPALAA